MNVNLPVIPASVPTHDNTMFSWHERCPRLHDVMATHGLRPRHRAVALDFGALLHTGLDTHYRTGDRNAVMNAMLEAEYDDPFDDHRTRGRAMITMDEYMDYYSDESEWFERILLTETPFELTDDEGFRYGGKIDLIVIQRGEPWIVDHKSTSIGGTTWWDEFRLSPQMIGYVWAGGLLIGQPIRGVIVNQLLIHKVKKSPDEQFNRQPFLISQELVAEWRQSRIEKYHEIGRQKAAGYAPPRYDNCKNRYGKCPMYNVCTLPIASRARALAQDFEHNPWDWRKSDDE